MVLWVLSYTLASLLPPLGGGWPGTMQGFGTLMRRALPLDGPQSGLSGCQGHGGICQGSMGEEPQCHHFSPSYKLNPFGHTSLHGRGECLKGLGLENRSLETIIDILSRQTTLYKASHFIDWLVFWTKMGTFVIWLSTANQSWHILFWNKKVDIFPILITVNVLYDVTSQKSIQSKVG